MGSMRLAPHLGSQYGGGLLCQSLRKVEPVMVLNNALLRPSWRRSERWSSPTPSSSNL